MQFSLEDIEETAKAIEFREESVKVLKELYKDYPLRWVKNFVTSLNDLVSSLKDIGDKTKAIEFGEESLELLKNLYKENPERWAEDYIISLNNLVFFMAYGLKSIELEKKSLEVLEKLYKEYPDIWIEDYISSLDSLAFSFYNIGKISEAIELRKKSIDVLKKAYYKDSDRWIEEYSRSLINLSGFCARKKEFKESSKLFEEYFKIVDFNNIDDIRDFIYPLIKWYQCEKHLKDYLKLEELKDLALNFRNLYKEKLDGEFEEEINEIFEVYKNLADNSDDDFDKEKFEIFQLIFF